MTTLYNRQRRTDWRSWIGAAFVVAVVLAPALAVWIAREIV